MSDFESATFYSASEVERLHCESPEEAMEERFATHGDLLKQIRDEGPIEVTGYRSSVVTDRFSEMVAESMVERAVEAYCEDFADPDSNNVFSNDATLLLQGNIKRLVHEFYATVQVWACEECGSRTYSVEEVEAIMRKERPEFFEVDDAEP